MGLGKFLGFVAGATVAVACAPAIGAIASVAGLGAAAGTLTGAAASSAGLAALGGGSLAAGGLGMAGGTAVVGAVGGAIASGTAGNFADSAIDNIIKDKVKPKQGSVVYCDLPVGEHSGIYVGYNKIVHLNGDGRIEKVSPSQFLSRLGGLNTAMSIYVSCDGKHSVGSSIDADFASSQIGKKRDYNLLLDNCHQFTSGCLTADFENSDNFLWMLKVTAKNEIEASNWRVWDLE